MELYDIVDSLNKIIKEDGKLMLNKSIVPHDRFPAYKCFKYTIWKVKDSSNKLEVFSHTETINTSNLDLTKCWESADRNFLTILLEWIIEKGYKYGDE